MKSEMEATRNAIAEDGGQFPKNELQAKFNNSLSQANFSPYRGEMENISEKITEEGMLIPNSITWAPFLLITIF